MLHFVHTTKGLCHSFLTIHPCSSKVLKPWLNPEVAICISYIANFSTIFYRILSTRLGPRTNMPKSRGRSLARAGSNPDQRLTCESARNINDPSDFNSPSTSSLVASFRDAPSGTFMAITSLWGVLTDVGEYWQSVSCCFSCPFMTGHFVDDR